VLGRVRSPRPSAIIAAIGLFCAATTIALTAAAAPDCPWVGSTAPVESRVAQVTEQMTFGEKLTMVHGALHAPTGIVGPIYAGLVPANPRLCIPQLGLLDGPAGSGDGLTGVTQLPAPIALAAGWDPDVAHAFGSVIASEHAGKGANVVLAPALDIVRDPRAGRGFEAFGEDPYLTSRLGVSEVQAVQGLGLIAQAKHYAAYNQEMFRGFPMDDTIVDERTLQEIYLPPFEAAVTEGGVGSVMCSYNYLNGAQACNNPFLLNQVLKGQWGFTGFVTTDWYAAFGGPGAANAGLDLQMPDDCFFGPALEKAIGAGRVPQARLDDMVGRILRSMFTAGLFDHPATGSPDATVTTPEHAAVARDVAARGMVLLKNSNDVLPIDPGRTHSIAVIGSAGDADAITGGGGSSHVVAPYVVTPLAGIRERAGHARVTYADGTNPVRTIQAARSADVAVVFASSMQGEFKDRPTIELFPTDTATIELVSHVNPNTVVVLNTGSAVTMPWLDDVAGVLQAWYPGQEYGHALADVLFGDVDPSGKLPITFPKNLTQVPARTPLQYPGVGRVEYSEGLDVGYRWYDQEDIAPLFPFGFGLSYTSFSVHDLTVDPTATDDGNVAVAVDVTNTGDRAGAEVVQLYLEHPPDAGEPPKVLRGFRRVALEPGQTAHVQFTLDARALAVWDATSHRWRAGAGSYTVHVGDSSRNLPLRGSFALSQELSPGMPMPPASPVPPTAPTDTLRDSAMCPKDVIAPRVNGVLSITGFPPLEVLGKPVP
jgi:beta-glucosidase-like glycosyl hydrolase